MKCIYFVSVIALASSSVTASAADAIFRNDVVPAPAITVSPAGYEWSGVYAGATAGALVKGDHLPGVRRLKNGSFVGGIHAGYNYQTEDNWVLGVEADGNWVNAEKRGAALKHYGSARVRVGHALGRFLPYVDGGVVVGRMTDGSQQRTVAAQSTQHTHIGYTLGAGLEYALTDKISTRISYHYIDLQKRDYTAAGKTQSIGYKGHVIGAGLSVKF
jgi:outer membrane immunogenic protein